MMQRAPGCMTPLHTYDSACANRKPCSMPEHKAVESKCRDEADQRGRLAPAARGAPRRTGAIQRRLLHGVRAGGSGPGRIAQQRGGTPVYHSVNMSSPSPCAAHLLCNVLPFSCSVALLRLRTLVLCEHIDDSTVNRMHCHR